MLRRCACAAICLMLLLGGCARAKDQTVSPNDVRFCTTMSKMTAGKPFGRTALVTDVKRLGQKVDDERLRAFAFQLELLVDVPNSPVLRTGEDEFNDAAAACDEIGIEVKPLHE